MLYANLKAVNAAHSQEPPRLASYPLSHALIRNRTPLAPVFVFGPVKVAHQHSADGHVEEHSGEDQKRTAPAVLLKRGHEAG